VVKLGAKQSDADSFTTGREILYIVAEGDPNVTNVCWGRLQRHIYVPLTGSAAAPLTSFESLAVLPATQRAALWASKVSEIP
jgi:hypothetical protein